VSSFFRRYFRIQDLVWLVLFSILAVSSPERDPLVLTLLVALGVVQVVEPRIGAIASVILQLILSYFIIGYSGGISSSLHLILLLPAITAATHFGVWGAVATTVVSCATYLSFLIFLNLYDQYIPEDQIREVALRVVFLPVVAFVTYQLASQKREEARKLQETAQRLQEAQAEVRRSERLAALGQLTAGLAHELRNPLGTMKSSAELLKRNVPADNALATEMAGYISEEVDRTNSLITRFLEFAKPQHMKLEQGDLTELLDGVIQRFEREHGAPAVSVYKNYSPDVGPVAFDGQLLERVFSNLLSNAAQASQPGAAVTVKTKPVETEAGKGVEVSIIDRGSGIDPKNLENIFNPFFTTKPDGVGLGLAIVSKIVDEHGGSITVESTPGEGSTFRVYLPVGE
jgi:two-component system, NtrC family, sensor histidine kinase HydH